MCIFARSMKKIADFLAKPFFHDYRTLFGLWILLPIIMWLAKMTRANNYLIYRGSFWNAVRGWNLYLPNPEEYGDSHHYGPLFSLLFAPFAIGPKWIGLLLWGLALTLFLYSSCSSSTLPLLPLSYWPTISSKRKRTSGQHASSCWAPL